MRATGHMRGGGENAAAPAVRWRRISGEGNTPWSTMRHGQQCALVNNVPWSTMCHGQQYGVLTDALADARRPPMQSCEALMEEPQYCSRKYRSP